MTSKIVVNNIQADSGINTVTFGSNIIVSAGSTSSPAISPSGDSNTGIYFPAADTVCIAEGGTEVLRVNSSGNIGLGVTVPGSKLDVDGEVTIRRTAPGSEGGQINFARASDNTVAWNIDAYGSTSTPSLRFVDSIAAASRAEIDGSGNFAFNSGYGSVATAYGCRAWVNFNGTGTVAIRASGNVTSITDNGVGDYTVNFTNAMPDANYCANVNMSPQYGYSWVAGASINSDKSLNESANTASLIRFLCLNNSYNNYMDPSYAFVSIFR